MDSKGIYRNNEISINLKRVPEYIADTIKLLDRLYESGQESKYILYLNLLYSQVKADYIDGKISEELFIDILDKYNAW